MLTQEQTFSQYLYTEVSNFVNQYQENVTNVDISLRNRVKHYRHEILALLEALESVPDSTGTKLTQDANRRYAEILRNTYHLIFNYSYYELYEYEYVFSPKNYSNPQKGETAKSKQLMEMMFNLEKEGKQLVSYVRELKASHNS